MSGVIATSSLQLNNRLSKYSRKLLIANLPRLADGQYVDITNYITQLSVSYTMDMASSISFEIVDPNLQMSERNYFQIGRDIIYETQTIGSIDGRTGEVRNVQQLFEIASVTVSQGPGCSPSFSIQCYTKAIQQMKRDKNPRSVKGNGTTFIKNAAAKYGLKFFGQQTSKAKQITKSSGSKQAESLWDVMQRLASDAKFVLFEIDGYLVFASEKWLFNKWGSESRNVLEKNRDKKTNLVFYKYASKHYIPLQFKNDAWNYVGRKNIFSLIEYPQITSSDNDPYAINGSCRVERTNATQIRPGMTAYVGLVPNMSSYALIESVTFDEMVPDPVSISFRSPTKDPEKDKIRNIRIGEKYQQTYIPTPGGTPRVETTRSAELSTRYGRNADGGPNFGAYGPHLDSRIINHPTSANPYLYPVMEYANLTIAYPLYEPTISAFVLFSNIKSTGDKDSMVVSGNINLYNLPVFPAPTQSGSWRPPATVAVYVYSFDSGSEVFSVLLPAIYNEGGNAVLKTRSQAIAKYSASGGYLGSAKHYGVFRGGNSNKSTANARDYAALLWVQQIHYVLPKRFPSIQLSAIPNTVGSTDSNW